MQRHLIYRKGSPFIWTDFRWNGKRIRESTGETDEAKAEEFVKRFLEVLEAEARQLPPGGATRFGEYAELWYRRKATIKPSTAKSYRSILDRRLLPFFKKLDLHTITRENIQDFVKKMVDEDLAPMTIKNVTGLLYAILSDALENRKILENPFRKIERPSCKGRERDHLQFHEIDAFLAACEPKNYALFYTAVWTGARRGELLGFSWPNVDWLNSQICVKQGLYKRRLQTPKTDNSVRAIDMTPGLIDVLKRHRAEQAKKRLKHGQNWNKFDLVFCQDNGRPIDADRLYHRDFKRVLKRAGLRHMTIHGLRHTYASILIAAGHNPKYIQKQMGHGSIEITMDLYGHMMEGANRGAARQTESAYRIAVERAKETAKMVAELGGSMGHLDQGKNGPNECDQSCLHRDCPVSQ